MQPFDPPSNGGLASSDLRLLAAMRHSLKTHVMPDAKSPMAQTICEFSINTLDYVLARYTALDGILADQLGRDCDLLRRSAALLSEVGLISAIEREAAESAVTAPARSLAELEHKHRELKAVIERLVPALAGLRSNSAGGDPQRHANKLLEEMVVSERAALSSFEQASERRAREFEIDAGNHHLIDEAQLQDYLRRKVPGSESARVTSLQELPGGSSKGTVLFDVDGMAGEGHAAMVARVDRSAGATDTTVVNEIDTLKAMFDNGLPVPELLWAESEPDELGVPFLLVRKVNGDLGGGMWHANPDLCNEDTARHLARILAQLHSFDTEDPKFQGALKLLPDRSIHPMTSLLKATRNLLERKKTGPVPILEGALCWLEQNIPPLAKRSLVHGDVSFHNILVKDKNIVSLLDWELSHLGDPIEDLSYARPCVEQLIAWDEFIAEYMRHGGCPYSDEVGGYYRAWREARNAVFCVVAQNSFHTGANRDVRWGFFANYLSSMSIVAGELTTSGD